LTCRLLGYDFPSCQTLSEGLTALAEFGGRGADISLFLDISVREPGEIGDDEGLTPTGNPHFFFQIKGFLDDSI
jgi:hypothetical protein